MNGLLDIRDLETGYGKKQVLFGLSLEVRKDEIVALIGPNGAGKSTVLKSIIGLLSTWNGEIVFGGYSIDQLAPAARVAQGLTLALQGGRVFHDLTVNENLEIGGYQLPRGLSRKRIEDVLKLFPELSTKKNRWAGTLSGGEQQMLALARSLIPSPKLLMLDEPSLGLSPNLVKTLFERIRQLQSELGIGVLVVEQKVREVLGIATRVYGLRLGRVIYEGMPSDLEAHPDKTRDIFLK